MYLIFTHFIKITNILFNFRCLIKIPEERPFIFEFLEHPFIKQILGKKEVCKLILIYTNVEIIVFTLRKKYYILDRSRINFFERKNWEIRFKCDDDRNKFAEW